MATEGMMKEVNIDDERTVKRQRPPSEHKTLKIHHFNQKNTYSFQCLLLIGQWTELGHGIY